MKPADFDAVEFKQAWRSDAMRTFNYAVNRFPM
jgi:hypothetical protein